MSNKETKKYEEREENLEGIPFLSQRTEKEIFYRSYLDNRKKIEDSYKAIRESKKKLKEIGEKFPEIPRNFSTNLKKRKIEEDSETEEEEDEEVKEKKRLRKQKTRRKLEKFRNKIKEKKKGKGVNTGSDTEMSEREIAKEGGRVNPADARKVVFEPVGGGRSRLRSGK